MTIAAQPLSVIRTLEAKGLAQGLALMERAGQCAATFVMRAYSTDTLIILLVGPGNNGGDALAAGLILQQHGYQVYAIMPKPPLPRSTDAHRMLTAWQHLGNTLHKDWPDAADEASSALILDGLFGIGLNKPLQEPWQTLIDQANLHDAKILALDIPSGIHADSGHSLGRPIQATWTLAFIAPTLTLVAPHAQAFVGDWTVCSLGIPTD